MEQVCNWLKRENLKGFLVALSSLVEYRFDDCDWSAFEGGLDEVSDDGWFRYPLVGSATLDISVLRQFAPSVLYEDFCQFQDGMLCPCQFYDSRRICVTKTRDLLPGTP